MFAAVCVLLAATGHILMSGQGVPAWTLLLAFAVTVAVAWALAGRERGLLAVTAMSVVVQSALHAVFSWSQSAAVAVSAPPVRTPMPMDNAHAAHAHMSHAAMGHGGSSPSGAVLTEAASAHDMAEMSSSFGMLSAHFLAALLSGLWMAHGERAAFRFLRIAPLRLFRPLCLLFAVFVPVVRNRLRVRLVRAGDERAPRQLLLAHSVISRGPPQALAVL
ncbi:hypothetical protein ACFV8T_00340 [Streptomyces sp. NPDC059832]|uniref:hypothetical protein n=1 Tax=Streptomyces sp. NPDC059832 TaxID=3346966 RepID=UPI0036495644